MAKRKAATSEMWFDGRYNCPGGGIPAKPAKRKPAPAGLPSAMGPKYPEPSPMSYNAFSQLAGANPVPSVHQQKQAKEMNPIPMPGAQPVAEPPPRADDMLAPIDGLEKQRAWAKLV